MMDLMGTDYLTQPLFIKMDIIRNLKQSPKVLALEQIMLFNGVKFPESKITLGIPKVLDMRNDIDDDSNTYIDAIVDSNYDNKFATNSGFLYRRLHLDNYLNGKNLITDLVYPMTTHQLLDDINVEYDLNITVDDIEDTALLNSSQPLVIHVKPTSLFWIGKEITMSLMTGTQNNYRNTEDGAIRITEDGIYRTINV